MDVEIAAGTRFTYTVTLDYADCWRDLLVIIKWLDDNIGVIYIDWEWRMDDTMIFRFKTRTDATAFAITWL